MTGHWSDLDRPPLDVAGLRRALRAGEPGSFWADAVVVESTASTNADLAATARAAAGRDPRVVAPGASLLVAEHQTAGRGRLDRAWVAPPRSALTFSVLLHPRVAQPRWPWLPLLAGVAVAEGVRATGGLDAGLKWPNDVLVGDHKLAGVLVERVAAPGGPAAVLGVGLNVSATRAELPVPTATSLALAGSSTRDRQVVLVAVLRALEALYAAWAEGGAAVHGLHASYVRRCRTLGRDVTVAMPDGSTLTGRGTAVDAGGRLELETAAGRRLLAAGDVLHVRRR